MKYRCKYCGQWCNDDPSDQEPPSDYCTHDLLSEEQENPLRNENYKNSLTIPIAAPNIPAVTTKGYHFASA
jgi:hypothetical protein